MSESDVDEESPTPAGNSCPSIAPALVDRKREIVQTGPVKKPKASEVVKPTKIIETKPKAPEARKIAPPLAIEDKSRDQTGASKKPKSVKPEIKDIPIKPKDIPIKPKRKATIQILDTT